jgi:predicted nucleotidyltransferase
MMAPDLAGRIARLAETRGLVAAYVFGSHAAGRAHAESDVDVAVLVDRAIYPTDDERYELRLRLLGDLSSALATSDVDLIVLNDVSPVLARAVLRDGTRVFCRDHDALHAFERTTLSRAADLAPFLRRMRRLTLDALAR